MPSRTILPASRLASWRRGVYRTVRWLLPVMMLVQAAVAQSLPPTPSEVITILDPTTPTAAGLVIIFSDPADAGPPSVESLQALAQAGQMTAVVDSVRFLAGLAGPNGECARTADDLTALKRGLIGRHGLAAAAPVVLAGTGAGGGLAYAVLAQSASGQFAGAMAMDFNPEVPGRVAVCPGAHWQKTPAGHRCLPVSRLNGFWRMASATVLPGNLLPYTMGSDHVFFPLRPYDDLASAIIGVLAKEFHPPPAVAVSVEDLPLVLLPADRRNRTMAVIYSGDGGWRDLDKQIGEALQQAGIPVVDVDTLRGFWHRQTPASAARDLERILDHFTAAWNTPDVLLIGYSFGADILPFMVNRLPPAKNRQIRLIALLGLSRAADFEIRMSGWVSSSASADALPLVPELVKLDPSLVQCFVGVEELDQSGCMNPALRNAQIVRTAGGHHFDGDYGSIVKTILDGAIHRGAGLPPP